MSNKTTAKGKRVPADVVDPEAEVVAEEAQRPPLQAVPNEPTGPETTKIPVNKLQVAQLTKAREAMEAAQERMRVVVEGVLAANGYERGEAVQLNETDEGFVLVVANAK